MVNYNPKVWFSLIFHSYSRHVMRTLWPALGFMAAFSWLCCYIILDLFALHEGKDYHGFHSTTSMHSLLGIVLGLFLVFRTNSAYDRWWEGRKLWGAVVNSTRNFSLKLNAYLKKDDRDNRLWFARMIPNFVFAMKEHLRSGVHMNQLELTGDENEEIKGVKHKPNRISALMYERINTLYLDNKLTGDQTINLDKELKDFTDLIGACERIRNTPIPYSYTMYIKKFLFIYIITLPFGFVTTSGYMTIPIVVLITFVLLSVELIAEEIEDPFGRDINDLPTDELSEKIKDNVREILV
jgi:putative membrane protein